MRDAITNLNYVAVLVVAVVGFLLGWLWYSPVLFAKTWMKEMGYTEESMKAEVARTGVAGYFIKGFLFTLLSTFGLAALLKAHGKIDAPHGALFGAFVGAFIAAARLLNAAVWEKASTKLQAIKASHEVVLFALQGAILGVWVWR